MKFNAFWKWLQKNGGTNGYPTKNLGGRGKFKIKASENNGTCTPQSSGKSYPFTKDQAEKVWGQFRNLPLNEKLMAGRYVDPKWPQCPNRICSPWIAASIRDFLISQI